MTWPIEDRHSHSILSPSIPFTPTSIPTGANHLVRSTQHSSPQRTNAHRLLNRTLSQTEVPNISQPSASLALTADTAWSGPLKLIPEHTATETILYAYACCMYLLSRRQFHGVKPFDCILVGR